MKGNNLINVCLLTGIAVTVVSFHLIASAADRVVVVPLGGKKCPDPAEKSITNSTGMTFNLIPAGTFTMGSPPAEPGRNSANETRHKVTLSKPFYMQTTEVTNKQWNTIIFESGLGAKPSISHTGDTYPVESVNWFEAAYFANRLSVVEGFSPCYTLKGCNNKAPGAAMECTSIAISKTCTGYRLPTEAQWEYAARAGTTTAYANPVYFDKNDKGKDDKFNANLHAMGWYGYNDYMLNINGDSAYETGTKPVAQKQANSWGLYDMHGNVYEWCQDLWDGSDYSSAPVTDPTGGVTGPDRVIRGGSWFHIAQNTRSAFRDRSGPGMLFFGLGFRLVLPSDE